MKKKVKIEVLKQKVKIEVSYPFNGLFGYELKFFCPECGNRIIKYSEKCDIISSFPGNGCGCLIDWSDLKNKENQQT